MGAVVEATRSRLDEEEQCERDEDDQHGENQRLILVPADMDISQALECVCHEDSQTQKLMQQNPNALAKVPR
jgi:hypothetical protein